MIRKVMESLNEYLNKAGFWDSEIEEYNEINKNGDYLENVIREFLEKDSKQRNYKFYVASSCISESPSVEFYAVAIGFGYFVDNNFQVDNYILRSVIR